ncbi:amidase [Nocardioides sp. R-C-SC26]|uniref:amidase n=1 Tax=Nocardioides sp. R-C-SC26 TaxID=2870414 RepID=UPI001E4A1851|nr:amidase [Nocardioides sp. R-C-SC26]
MTRVTARRDDALGEHDAVGLVEAIQAGEVAIPEVVEAAISRVEEVDPALGAMAYRAFDGARREARTPRGGYFAGVPTVIKDNVDVAGMPTREGTDAWTPSAAKRDGDFARMYRATGLIPLGKSQLSEYGFSAAAEHPRLGPVRSPWHTDHIAGASSAGAAALVASGALPIAHANDGGGSIRIPASVNGLVGLKPTRDRLAQDRLLRQMPVRIISDGVVTRSVRDTAAFLREAEKVYRNLRMPPIGDITRPGRRRLRIALNTSGMDGQGADADTTAQTHAVASLLEELGHSVREIDPPIAETFRDDFLLYWSSLALVMVRAGRRLHGRTWDASRLDNLTLGLARHSTRRLHLLPGAVRRLRQSSELAGRLAREEGIDVVLTPTLAHATPEIGYLDPTQDYDTIIERLMGWVRFTPLQNATGDPAISLPLATSANGLPLGMMFAGQAGHEAMLLELAYELEEARPFARLSS